MTSATHRWTALLLLALAPAAFAQATLGDEFIIFVNGTNVMVPASDATTVNDPVAPASGNKVARFNNGDWTHGGFAWSRSEGVDASGMVGAAFGEGKTLYFRLLSDAANADKPGVSIMLSDKTDDSGANDGTADNEFRLLWTIPNEMHDGAWHDVAVQLPPTTYAALEEARTNGDLDGTPAANWSYPGAWSSGGFGIGPGFGGDTADPLWREFEWANLYKIGPFWDNNAGGGPIYLDDVYFGDADTDVSDAANPPAAMTGVTVSADGAANVIDWDDQGFGGYKVYGSLDPFTSVTDEGVILLRTFGFGGATQLAHRYELPHPSLGAAPLYYAVTSLSGFGVENQDISASSGSVSNPGLAQKAFIKELTDDQANDLFDALSAGSADGSAFGDDHPVFYLNETHRSPGDGVVGDLPGDADISGAFKIGYTSFDEMIVYGEITDDQVTLPGDATGGGDTWMFDSAEVVFGHYDVRNTDGGGLLVGSTHQDMQRGAQPDYGIRIAGHQDEAGAYTRTSTWIGWSLDVDQAGASVYERTATGYKFLSIITLNTIQNTDDGDVFMDLPASDEIQYIPFILSLNDADGATRETQIVWSIKPNVTNQWWNTPAMWETVAIAGAQYGVAVEDGTLNEGFALGQSVPNPAAQTAEIRFQLATASPVRVEVFNMLGQRVAMPADGSFGPGAHSVTVDAGALAAGVYVYRLTAGDYVAARRMTVVR